MSFLKIISFVALTLLLPGCDRNEAKVPSGTVSTNQPAPYMDHAQPKLATLKLWIGPKEMDAEVAITHLQVHTGMMYRKEMRENDGMLFVFGRPHQASFYMRNTFVPLSCAYVNPEGTILELHDLKPLDETPVEASSDQVQYVLETPQGWFKRNNIAVGTLIRSERGSLQETFFGKREP